jgi:aromatic-L-amino-acid decarboxylase
MSDPTTTLPRAPLGPGNDLGPDPANLEFTPEAMLAMGELVVSRAVEHISSLARQPIRGDLDAGDLCRALREPAPEEGSRLELLVDLLFNDLVPRSFNAPGPGYMAYIPGGGVYPAALADFIANTTNRFTGIWMAAPALVQLEANALDWLRDWMQFPDTARGLLTTGGSMANFNAIICARERHLGADIRRGVLYTSDQVHHSVMKSARLAGVMPDRVRTLPVDAGFRMRPDALEDAIASDRRAGLEPFIVVSTAGTTNTGAVDPLDRIADVCAREGVWHHVDGAYGAFFYACDELRPLLSGLSRADSLTLDPHKGMFLPYGTGALLVRDGGALRAAHSATAGYLPSTPDADDFYDPHAHGPDLSRGFPGLRLWLAIKMFGARRYRAAILEKRQLAVEAAARLETLQGLVMVAPPQLSLFAFHVDWPGATLPEQNSATLELMERVTARGRVMLTGCTTGGRYLGRVCVLSFRSRRDQVDTCVTDLTEELRSILDARGRRDGAWRETGR